MNKIKTRHIKRATHTMHAKRHGKHTTRKWYGKYKKHYTRKNVKRIQGQGKRRLRRQRQTRRKVGGEPRVREFNFVLPSTDPRFQNIQIQGKGWAYVTKLESLLSQSDRPEQLIIFQNENDNGVPTGNYFIARCSFAMCNINDKANMYDKNMEKELLETSSFNKETNVNTSFLSYTIETESGKKYRIKPAHSSDQPRENLLVFFSSYAMQKNAAADADAQAAAQAKEREEAQAAAQAKERKEAQAAAEEKK